MTPGQFITDPWYNPAYGQEFGETWEFYPGKTTHVDTIVIPIAAMTSSRLPLDCQFPDQTPIISNGRQCREPPLNIACPRRYDRDNRIMTRPFPQRAVVVRIMDSAARSQRQDRQHPHQPRVGSRWIEHFSHHRRNNAGQLITRGDNGVSAFWE
jgi:hypothetical protein